MMFMPITKPWSGIVKLTRPVEASVTNGPWVDIFHRERDNSWLVWSLIPQGKDGKHKKIILLGAFIDQTDAQFAADTVMAYAREGDGFLPLTTSLVDESEDIVDVMHGISHHCDSAPLQCEHRQSTKILPKLTRIEIEAVTKFVETRNRAVQDWRIMAVPGSVEGQVIPTLIRLKGTRPIAAIALLPSMFMRGNISYWLESREHKMKVQPVKNADQMVLPWGMPFPMLDHLDKIMSKCDKVLNKKHGSSSNANTLIEYMREESRRTSARLLAHAFGTLDRVGEA